jgi:heterodisulfide reductase subunit A
MYAIKQAILAKEHIPDADIHVFYMDIRAYGKGFEEFYTRAKEEFNVKFVRGAVSEIVEIPETKNLIVRVEDTETGELLEKEFDMVVLSVGLTPPSDSEAIENILGISKGEDGFFSSPDPQIFTVDTNIGGIFIAGTAEGPKDIPDSVAQASAAAMKASVALVQLTQEEKHVEK